jgi:glycosyltransferase involved in cell wall biosynthesis
MIRWAILTGEYPPDPGGVSDYSRLVATALVQAGDEVRVFAPPRQGKIESDDLGIAVHRLPGRFGPQSLHMLEQSLMEQPRPHRVLVQYVPHAFGFKAMNLLFASWVAYRLPRIAPVWIMFHEVVFPLRRWPLSHALLGMMTRVSARLVGGSASRVFVSIPAWGRMLKQICPHSRPSEWLPVPCNVAMGVDPTSIAVVREKYIPPYGFLVGHFGTMGGAVRDLLIPASVELLRLRPDVAMLFIGRGSDLFRDRFMSTHPEVATRVYATGDLSASAVSAHMRACDLLIQPFPDGISCRRGSAMAALANGMATVTNLGSLSESLWPAGAVVAAPTPDPTAMARLAAELLTDPARRATISQTAISLYHRYFALENTISRLREPVP